MRAKHLTLAVGIAVALAALPAGADATLIVPKADGPPPVMTPQAVAPQAPPASTQTPSRPPAPSSPTTGMSPEPRPNAPAAQGQSPHLRPAPPRITPQQEQTDLEERIKWVKYQLQQYIALRSTMDVGWLAIELADLEKQLADVNGKLAAAKAVAYANAIPPEKLTEDIEPEMLTEGTQPASDQSLPPIIEQFADPFNLFEDGSDPSQYQSSLQETDLADALADLEPIAPQFNYLLGLEEEVPHSGRF
jgi:hypothetical protein